MPYDDTESGGICTFCGAKVALNHSEQSEKQPAHCAAGVAKGVRSQLDAASPIIVPAEHTLHLDD